ncbi:non-specific protein-tyrosine kinase, variant 2 [Balamuthia mandrillaris]
MESRSLLLFLGVVIMLPLVQVWAVEALDMYAVTRTKPTGLVRPWEEVTVWVQVADASEPYFNVTVEVGGYNGLNGITYDVFSATFEEDSIWACEIVPYPNRTAGFGRCTSTTPAISFDELTFRAIVASDMESLKSSQSVFDQGLVQIYGWTEENEIKQQQLAGFWVSVGAPSTNFKGLITEMEPEPLEGYVPGVSSHSFLPLFENLGPSRVLYATCNIILSPSWATKWDAERLAANTDCKISHQNESIVECNSANHEPVPKNMVLNFWSANETLVPPKLGFAVTSPSIREPITVTTSCTTPYVYSNDPTPTVILLGDIDAQVAAFFQAPVNASATVNEAMHWSVDLTNYGRSSSLNSRCTWNFSLPLEEHAFFASTNRSDCLPSFSQVDEMLMIQCVGDVHPQQRLRLDFQLTFTHSLPASYNLHVSVICLDELEKVVLVEHASFVVVGGDSGNSDADLSSKEIDMALSLGLGLGVPVMCLLLAGGFWLWRQQRTRTRKKTLSAIQTTELKDGLNGNICSVNSNSTKDLELGFSWEIPFEELEFNDEIGRGYVVSHLSALL